MIGTCVIWTDCRQVGVVHSVSLAVQSLCVVRTGWLGYHIARLSWHGASMRRLDFGVVRSSIVWVVLRKVVCTSASVKQSFLLLLRA